MKLIYWVTYLIHNDTFNKNLYLRLWAVSINVNVEFCQLSFLFLLHKSLLYRNHTWKLSILIFRLKNKGLKSTFLYQPCNIYGRSLQNMLTAPGYIYCSDIPVDTTILVHFFGKKGDRELRFEVQFLETFPSGTISSIFQVLTFQMYFVSKWNYFSTWPLTNPSHKAWHKTCLISR